MNIYEKSMRGMLLNITMGHLTYLEGGMIGYVADPRRGRGPDRTARVETSEIDRNPVLWIHFGTGENDMEKNEGVLLIGSPCHD